MSDTIIKVRDLRFSYGKNTVLNHINIDINKGDYIGIVGPNGSAKSTLLKLMLGILKPDKGTIEMFGQNIKHFDQWRKIGYLSQQVREFNNRFPATVEEIVGANLYSQMGFLKTLNKEHKRKIEEVLTIVEMEGYKKRLIGNLSGGQQQRVFIARVLISRPEIILMDEPLVGVDISSQEKFYELIGRLNKDLGITLVMVSHDIGIISNKVSKVACLGEKGLYLHNSGDFNENTCVQEVFGGSMNIIKHQH